MFENCPGVSPKGDERKEWEEISHQLPIIFLFRFQRIKNDRNTQGRKEKLKPQKSEKYSLPIAYIQEQRMDTGLDKDNPKLR